MATSAESGNPSPFWVRAYVLTVMITLPMDWFQPTATLLRELGGKPAILVLMAGAVCGLLSRAKIPATRLELSAVALLAALLSLGFGAALINFILGWSGWLRTRDPSVQLASQALMIVAAGMALLGNARLARIYPIADLAGRYLLPATLFHFCIFGLEAAKVISDSAGPLTLFRAQEGDVIERPTGLFSEPSYFGVFAALYGSGLLVQSVPTAGRRFVQRVLPIVLYASAVLIGAKTLVAAAGVQAVYFVMRQTRSIRTKVLGVVAVAIVSAGGVVFIQIHSGFDVQANLSSAVRLGSTVLASNVAMAGYALPGIGIGQFHFFYRTEFAPNFIYASIEAIQQLSSDADNRASTYNFYIRVLIELGVFGLVMLLFGLRKLWQSDLPASMKHIQLLFAGSLGFLMTQDTYFYPPLVFAAALIMSHAHAHAQTGPQTATAARLTREPAT